MHPVDAASDLPGKGARPGGNIFDGLQDIAPEVDEGRQDALERQGRHIASAQAPGEEKRSLRKTRAAPHAMLRPRYAITGCDYAIVGGHHSIVGPHYTIVALDHSIVGPHYVMAGPNYTIVEYHYAIVDTHYTIVGAN